MAGPTIHSKVPTSLILDVALTYVETGLPILYLPYISLDLITSLYCLAHAPTSPIHPPLQSTPVIIC